MRCTTTVCMGAWSNPFNSPSSSQQCAIACKLSKYIFNILCLGIGICASGVAQKIDS